MSPRVASAIEMMARGATAKKAAELVGISVQSIHSAVKAAGGRSAVGLPPPPPPTPPAPRTSPFSAESADELRQLVLSGSSADEIAEALGLSMETVRYRTRKLMDDGAFAALSPDDETALREMNEEGVARSVMARNMGLSQLMVSLYLYHILNGKKAKRQARPRGHLMTPAEIARLFARAGSDHAGAIKNPDAYYGRRAVNHSGIVGRGMPPAPSRHSECGSSMGYAS